VSDSDSSRVSYRSRLLLVLQERKVRTSAVLDLTASTQDTSGECTTDDLSRCDE
jgi:hypothetical protein